MTVTNAFLPLIIGFPSLKLVQWIFPWQGITNKPQDSSLSQLMMHEWPSVDELSIRNVPIIDEAPSTDERRAINNQACH